MTPPIPIPDLSEAAALHGAGRLAEAGALYQRILAAKPGSLAAVHGLALIALDLGEPDRAVPLLARCMAHEPQNGLYRTSLGLALLRKGQFEQAAAHLVDAANLMPTMPEPRLYLARALGALNRWSQAADVLSGTAKMFPDRADIWAAKGNAERLLSRHAKAEKSLRRALALSPADPDVLNNLGVVLRALARPEEAVDYYRQALAQAPDHSVAHANLGNALAGLGHTAEAEAHLRRVIELAPSGAEAQANLASFLTAQDRPAEAIPHFRAALNIAPDNIDAWTNLGVALLDAGNVLAAEESLRHAIVRAPDNAEAHYNLAWVLLLTGRWPEGWAEYEWRWKLSNFSSRKRNFRQPQWDGTTRGEATILLHAEQGLGDAIQGLRYVGLIKARCARVVVECPQVLVRLFETAPGVDAVVAAGTPLPPFDTHAPFMTLPGIFGTTPESVPAAEGYLTAPARARGLPVTGRRRIGLVWAGSPDNKIDRRRTLPARLFAPLVARTDADFVSLQVGPGAGQVKDLPGEKVIFACEGGVADFADTAAVVSQLDLIIGVDTAVMHLAGAMATPGWMLLPTMPDYRWLLERSDTPWYQSIRLFRQGNNENWESVLARVADALTIWQQPAG